MGYSEPDDLRDLGIMLKNAGMTAPQCAMGLRIAHIMQSLGIDEENFRTFISEIYQHCTEIGLRPQKVAENVKQLLELSETIPLWQIPQYISDKTSEKRELVEDILRLKRRESQARCSFELALSTTNVSSKQLNDFCELRANLEKTGISLDDIEPFVKAVEGVKKFGYDVKRLATLMSNFQASSKMQAELEVSVNSQMSNLKNLTDECDRLETLLRIHNLSISKYRELEDMGFGLPQLGIVQDTIHEVARANNISNYLAIEKFLNDILENYEPKSGYERKIHALRSEIEKKKSGLIVLTTALDSKKEVAQVLGQLVSIGLQDKQIIDLALSLHSKPNHKQEHVGSSTTHGSLNRLAEDSNQQIELAKDHVDSPDLGVARNSADVHRGITDHAVIAGLVSKAFPGNPLTFVGGKYPPSLHNEDLEDIREMQELTLARKSSNSQARGD